MRRLGLFLLILWVMLPTAAQEGVVLTPANSTTVREVKRFGRGSARDVAFLPDGSMMAVASSVGVWLYDTADLLAEPRFIQSNYTPTALALAPNGRTIALGDSRGVVHMIDVEAGSERSSLLGHSAYITEVAYSPNGRFIATTSFDGTARLWDSGGVLRQTITAPGRSHRWPSTRTARASPLAQPIPPPNYGTSPLACRLMSSSAIVHR